MEVASFPFLSQLKLRSAINLSAEPLHDKASNFFHASGVTLLDPQSLESFDGPYDLWEEAAKESLELLLDADNHPMILIDSSTECEAACLVGCLRRLQHWSMVAIHDEYHMMAMRNTRYSTSQRFIERFDLDLVTLGSNLPPWYRNHLAMLEEERSAEAEARRQDPDRPAREWTRGFSPSPSPSPSPSIPEEKDGCEQPPQEPHEASNDAEDGVPGNLPVIPTQSDSCSVANQHVGVGSVDRERSCPDHSKAEEGNSEKVDTGKAGEAEVQEDAAESGERTGEGRPQEMGTQERGKASRAGDYGVGEPGGVGGGGRLASVPDFRLNGFVHVCPLLSEGCKFTAKAWLQDEDD
ncbi:unnamed protein product [Scytosiphon promiscuus]